MVRLRRFIRRGITKPDAWRMNGESCGRSRVFFRYLKQQRLVAGLCGQLNHAKSTSNSTKGPLYSRPWRPDLSAISVLSKGVHELDEQTCLNYFPILNAAIELIAEDKLSQHEIEKRKKATQEA